VSPARPFEVDLSDICLCHWPVDADRIAGHVPDWLSVDTAEGDAWVTVVAATVGDVRSFGFELTAPGELVTIGTPVRGPDAQRGVFFLSVFASDRLTDAVGTRLFGLPARHGHIERFDDAPDGRRRRTVDVGGRVALDVTYKPPDRAPGPTPPDSLAAFLVDRARYFTEGALGVRLCGSTTATPWSVSAVDADVSADLTVLGLPAVTETPLVHHCPNRRTSLAPPMPLGLP
jgi:uncharacterized protein YqjF (DUF2071 family)